MNAPLDSFETALLARLRDHVKQQTTVPARVSRRPRVLLAAAVTVAAAAAMVVVLPGLGPTAAYSVQEGNTGVITVKVLRPEDAAGLESELAEYGIKADITYVPQAQECAPGRYTPVDRRLSGMTVEIGAQVLRVTLPPGTVRDGETFVMAVSGKAIPPATEPSPDGSWDMEGYGGWAELDVTASPVQPCKVVPGRLG